MGERVHIRPGVAIDSDEIELRTSRSSGPGGQHANVTASRVEAVFDVAASSLREDHKRLVMSRLGPRVTASAQDTRSQLRNRELATARLADRLARALAVQRPRTATKPTRASKKRRIEAKKQRGATKKQRGRVDPDG